MRLPSAPRFPLKFKFEMQHHPNHSFQADRDPREHGPGPLNSSR
jgi:hypothetical protein